MGEEKKYSLLHVPLPYLTHKGTKIDCSKKCT